MAMTFKKKHPDAYEEGKQAGQRIIKEWKDPVWITEKAAEDLWELQHAEELLKDALRRNARNEIIRSLERTIAIYEGILSCYD